MNPLNPKVISIAKSIRKKCEKFALSSKSKNYDFHGMEDLGCMCAVASFVLREALRKNGIACQVVRGEYDDETHCWVELDDGGTIVDWVELKGGTIVDITATQFGVNKKVYISDYKNKKYKWLDDYGYVEIKDMKEWDSQKPSNHLTKKILKEE